MRGPMPIIGFHWRQMTSLDMPDVGAIADIVHPGFPEELPVLAEKQRLYPEGARLLEIGGRPSGYLFSHPWPARTIPPLNTLLRRLPAATPSYYLHDLALLPEARGSGAAPAIVSAIIRHALNAGFGELALCAVNRSRGFWERQGFAVRCVPDLRLKLNAYSRDARYMTRDVTDGG